ncbi:PAS domain S-box protein [Methanoregula sp.]|uniref:PAS domain S-box protein n=1 Tax=Methanoregula sp. TaxID=2052170 RepID=UPI003567DC65
MISVLYVDDEPVLLDLCRIFLERTGEFSVDILESATGVPGLLETKHYDAVIADYQMPEMDGITLLKIVRTRFGDIPFILFTGRGREEIVIEALNSGADFYLQKGGDAGAQFTELAHKVRQAVGKRRAECDLRTSEKRLFDIINFLPDPTFAINREGQVIAWNRAMEGLSGVSSTDILGKGDYEYSIPFYGHRRPILIDLISASEEHIMEHYSGIIREKDVLIAETDLPHPGGHPIIVMGKASPLYNTEGEITGAIESIRDITPRKKAEDELRSAYEEVAAAEEELREQFDSLAQNQKELRESEARFRLLSETTTASIFVFRQKILYVNPAAGILTGYSPEELVGMPFWEFVHPGFSEKVKERGLEMLKREERSSHEIVRIVRKDGEMRWVDASTTQILYDGIPAVLSVQVDITERKQDTDRLFRLYETFHRFGPDPLKNIDMITALAGELLHGTCAYYYRRDSRCGRKCIGSWNLPDGFTDDDSLGSRIFVDVIRQGKDNPVVITDMGNSAFAQDSADLGRFPFATYVGKTVRIGNDYYGVLSVLYQDVFSPGERDLEFLSILANAIAIEDERWQAQEALRDSMEKYRGLFELGSEAIFLIDNETGWLLEANEAATEMYGYSHEELLTMKNTDLSAEPEKTREVTTKSVTGSVSIPLRYHRKKDGMVFPVEINGRFFTWEGRHVHVAASHDITDRKQGEEALRRANKKLNLLNSITRHDVVNQLTVLQGYSQLALLRGPDPVVKDFLAKIDAVSDTIARQIAFTGMYQELGVQAPCWQNLNEVLSRVRPKEILFSSSCGMTEIYADPMLEKVFANLFDNALRHGERVSRITISCEPEDEDLRIYVEDNGVGIPLDIKPKIFQKGFGKHTGFGLFLVREILAITGISIHETGKHGNGARFEITVPKGGFRQEKTMQP